MILGGREWVERGEERGVRGGVRGVSAGWWGSEHRRGKACALRRWRVEGGRPKDERRRGEGAPPLRGARAAAAGVQKKKEGAARRPPVPCPHPPPIF